MIGLLLVTFAFSALKENELVEEIQTISSSFEKKDIEQREVLSQVYTIQTEQKKIEKDLERLEEKRKELTVTIKKNMDYLEDLKTQMQELKTLISMRLRVSGQIVDSSLKDIILLSKNPNEIERFLKGISYLLDKDIQLVKKLDAKRLEYIRAQEQTTLKVKELTANKQIYQEKSERLSALKNQKKSYIAKIQVDKKRYLNLLTELRKRGEEGLLQMDEKINPIIRKSFFENKKQLAMPIQGQIVQDFGAFERLSNIKLFSKGIYFEVDEARDVSSVSHGKVIFVGDVKDYKNTVVLDHGNHYYTVYSFLREVRIKVGQDVEKQQIIGRSGYNPYLNVDGIYFEIRHFSDPLNPADWFMNSTKAISKNQSSKGDTL